MAKIEPQPGIMDIALYQSGKAKVAGVEDVVKISANENPFGPSPKAVQAHAAAALNLHRYPGTDHAGLRSAIGDINDIDPDRIVCGVGSDEVLQMVTQSYAGPGDEIILTEHGFSMYPILAHAAGATPVTVPERDRVVDVDQILQAVTDRTRIVFIANPANPTGTMLGGNELERLAGGLPDHVILVHDGAYAEFVDDFDGGIGLVDRYPNVVMTRTFSKIYGLGGLRIGWGYAARDIIDVLNRVRQPFNLSEPQLAAAEAAMRDTDYTAWCRAENTRLRDVLRRGLADMGIQTDRSHTNFVLARFDSAETAKAADAFLQSRGLIVRAVGGYGLPAALRMSVGDEPTCTRLLDAMRAFVDGGQV